MHGVRGLPAAYLARLPCSAFRPCAAPIHTSRPSPTQHPATHARHAHNHAPQACLAPAHAHGAAPRCVYSAHGADARAHALSAHQKSAVRKDPEASGAPADAWVHTYHAWHAFAPLCQRSRCCRCRYRCRLRGRECDARGRWCDGRGCVGVPSR